jgi:hypothetical protein
VATVLELSDIERDCDTMKLKVSVGEYEVFIDADEFDTEKGVSLSTEEADELGQQLIKAARESETFKYGN